MHTPTENLPVPPPLRQDANLRPDGVTLFVPVGSFALTVSDHEQEHDTASDEEPGQTRATAGATERATRRAHAHDNDPRRDELKDGKSDSD